VLTPDKAFQEFQDEYLRVCLQIPAELPGLDQHPDQEHQEYIETFYMDEPVPGQAWPAGSAYRTVHVTHLQRTDRENLSNCMERIGSTTPTPF
jgi:hypothetical protein